MKTPTFLVILDGFGSSSSRSYNAISSAQKPTWDFLLKNYPHMLLQASGKAVGLPANTNGNSEVGHITLGAGRVILQPSTRINAAIADGSLAKNPVLTNALHQLHHNNGRLHLMGLLSDGGVHSLISHLYSFLEISKTYAIKEIFIHGFLDGRDVSQSATVYLEQLTQHLNNFPNARIGTLTGRFYAMDRDNNWQRTESCYQMLTQEQEVQFSSWQDLLDYYYQQNIFDEFIPPTQLIKQSIITKNDGIIFFNFRPDRARQIIAPFVDSQFDKFPLQHIPLSFFITPVSFDHDECPTQPLFETPPIKNTLLECLSKAGKSTFAIAETEKYAHVTYFFAGGQEKKFDHETRILIPSLSLRSYAENPEMSTQQITDALITSLEKKPCDFYLVNYANADMVGHSGNFNATVKAVECLDKQLGILYQEVVQKRNGTLFITADHGNAEEMVDVNTGLPKTSHTTNPVYFIMVKKGLEGKPLPCILHELSDVAPCILQEMRVAIPQEMQKK